MLRVRTEVNDCLAIAHRDWAPFVALATSELGEMISGNADSPNVSPVDIAAIGVEENGFPIRSQRPLLDFAVPRCEHMRVAAFDGNRVEVLPAVFFRSDEQPILGGPANHAATGVFGHVRIGTIRRGTAVPYFTRTASGHVRDPNCPGMRLIGLKKVAHGRVALLGGAAHECYALAIERPNWIAVGVDTWSEKPHGVAGQFVDTDEAVVAARGDESQLRSVERPFLGMILAAHN